MYLSLQGAWMEHFIFWTSCWMYLQAKAFPTTLDAYLVVSEYYQNFNILATVLFLGKLYNAYERNPTTMLTIYPFVVQPEYLDDCFQLTEFGKKEVKVAAERFKEKNLGPAVIWTSDLPRAETSARQFSLILLQPLVVKEILSNSFFSDPDDKFNAKKTLEKYNGLLRQVLYSSSFGEFNKYIFITHPEFEKNMPKDLKNYWIQNHSLYIWESNIFYL